MTWIIEITSQIIFSNSASVSFELLVSRDERSLDLGLAAVARSEERELGQVHDHQQGKHGHASHPAQRKGVYSKAVNLVVDDTTSLWDKPALPEWEEEHKRASQDEHRRRSHSHGRHHAHGRRTTKKQRKIHLVVLTHGLHSNLGADMLYMKESIDATVKQARESARQRRRAAQKAMDPDTESNQEKQDRSAQHNAEHDTSTAPLSGGQEDIEHDDGENESGDEEEVVVRGFNGNCVRTERGIQYLGKRLARYVLEMTYPDQPFIPVEKTMANTISSTLSGSSKDKDEGVPAPPKHSVKRVPPREGEQLPYKFTSISFIGHSLGGLVQTYAIAYIHKHSPEFFQNIRPINFICMASPLLGLSNENPMYVKFALDFGLVGRTGQDLGLSWRPPTLAKSGWAAMMSAFGADDNKKNNQEDPSTKPLLRILPTGPAHQVLRMFRNRTTYSNVVNDGIVPLRTSCLLFLDWRGLGRVEKARRENGLIGTVATWGWSELTGQYSSPNPSRGDVNSLESPISDSQKSPTQDQDEVPQPSDQAISQDDESQAATKNNEPQAHQFLRNQKRAASGQPNPPSEQKKSGGLMPPALTLDGILNFFRPSTNQTKNDRKMFQRSQTIQAQQAAENSDQAHDISTDEGSQKRPRATRGDSIIEDPTNPHALPKTTIFESAGDILNPPVPPRSWIIDPSTRARTIFHDRVYHPEDIPPPPMKRPTRLGRSFSSDSSFKSDASSAGSIDSSSMRVEEKIARAYHKDLSWRKVLVRLEPDAHNNIFVRRMFANAYGWPVVKHLCDTHFADTYSAKTRDENEPARDRAQGVGKETREQGEEVVGQREWKPPRRTASEMREATDELAPLREIPEGDGAADAQAKKLKHKDSDHWDDAYFEGTTDEEDEDGYLHEGPMGNFLRPAPKGKKKVSERASAAALSQQKPQQGTSESDINDFLTASPRPMDGHRGLAPSMPDADAAKESEPDSAPSFTGMEPVRSPPPMEGEHSGGSTVQLGLRKSVEERLSSPESSPNAKRRRSGSGGVSEQVARLSLGHSS